MEYLHTMIRVTDLKATTAFFELLGLVEARRVDNEKGRYTLVFLAAPGDLDRGFWDEINLAIITYGGSLLRFFNDRRRRSSAFLFGDHSDGAGPGWPGAPPRLPVPATGPP